MIGIIGINHKTAPLEIRERLVFQEPEIAQFIAGLKERDQLDGGVVLSTCNRTELIFYRHKNCSEGALKRFIRALTDFKEIKTDFREHFYIHRNEEAVDHLFQVAAGLDSLVLGENQVLGQVKEAYRISAERKLTGAVLNRLFHKAFEAGKKVRTETSINQGTSSLGYAAVEVASKIFGDLTHHSVLLIGAGETGELVLQCLTKRNCRTVFITNRTRRRAETLAEKYNANVVDFGEIREYLHICDIIITSTASKTPLVQYSDVREAVKKRKGHPVLFVDLSVPRDVSEEVRELENVFLYDIDDLDEMVAYNYEKRKNEIRDANRIIKTIASDFFAWLSSLNLAPTIGLLKEKIDSITHDELHSLYSKMTEAEYKKVSDFALFLKGKYLGLIIKNLKVLSNKGRRLEYIQLVNDLFELSKNKSNEE